MLACYGLETLDVAGANVANARPAAGLLLEGPVLAQGALRVLVRILAGCVATSSLEHERLNRSHESEVFRSGYVLQSLFNYLVAAAASSNSIREREGSTGE
ncbi:hypothetical protein TSAR_007604 [Trichomalopsis sarcophagae]|uniref:Uncharacterized protein n=1 Tax=Trichomalopsis sarcophagae TaxID=543379 RepID=A0A232FP07_9HYME|nr:hypothetical protein TSAR_007604 [Trichomalopsis sarcophagae]